MKDTYETYKDLNQIPGSKDIELKLLKILNKWEQYPDGHYTGIAVRQASITTLKRNGKKDCTIHFYSSTFTAHLLKEAINSFSDPVRWEVTIRDCFHTLGTRYNYTEKQLRTSQQNLAHHLNKNFKNFIINHSWRAYPSPDELGSYEIRDFDKNSSAFDVASDLITYISTRGGKIKQKKLRELITQKYGEPDTIDIAFETLKDLKIVNIERGNITLIDKTLTPKALIWTKTREKMRLRKKQGREEC